MLTIYIDAESGQVAIEETEFGLVCIANREDLIWLKRFRNSKQDLADIEALENDENTEKSLGIFRICRIFTKEPNY